MHHIRPKVFRPLDFPGSAYKCHTKCVITSTLNRWEKKLIIITYTSNRGKIYSGTYICNEDHNIGVSIKWQIPGSSHHCAKYNHPHTDESLDFSGRKWISIAKNLWMWNLQFIAMLLSKEKVKEEKEEEERCLHHACLPGNNKRWMSLACQQVLSNYCKCYSSSPQCCVHGNIDPTNRFHSHNLH